MPFTASFRQRRLIERIADQRRNRVWGFAIAIAAIGVATLARWAAGPYLTEGLPFLTYYPAVIVATLFGGLGSGVLALVLAAGAATFLFLPPVYHWVLELPAVLSLAVFVALGGLNVAVVAVLNSALDRVVAQERNMTLLIEAAPNGILVADQAGNIRLVNSCTERLFGYSRSELLGRKIDTLLAGQSADAQAILGGALEQDAQPPLASWQGLQGRRKDGSEFPIEIGLNPIRHSGRRGLLATVIDVSERKQARDRQQLLVDELRHRAQNLITVIQTIARRSLRRSDPGERQEFLDRLVALGRAHALLADAAWQGAPLSEIIEREFAAFSSRVSASGCDVMLSPSAAQQFALIIHELATNAVKYGSLSVASGRVSVEWNVERCDNGDVFRLAWRETGGPPVRPPGRKGFGSTILVEATRGICGNGAMDFAPSGLGYELAVPLSTIVAASGSGTVAGTVDA
jgi:PAS domain S-box-containing protein